MNTPDSVIDASIREMAEVQAHPQAPVPGMPMGQDTQVLARFYVKPVENKRKSAEAGRPVFEDRTYIELRAPGSKDPMVGRPMREGDKQRFAMQWNAYQQGLEDPAVGTPLAEWPQITRSRLEELRFYGIRTVEELANVADSAQAMGIMGLPVLKQQAKDWLESAENITAPLERLRAENADLTNTVETQAEAIRELAEKVKALEDRPANRGGKGRGRNSGVDDLT